MDLPVHLAAGAVAGNAMLYVDLKFRKQFPCQRQSTITLGLAGFLWGILLHLLEEWVPYYDWLFGLHFLSVLPFWWLIPQFLTAIPVLLFVFALNRGHWGVTAASVLGGVYPDIEKLAYFDLHLPRDLVLFQRHSCCLSQWTPWELAHQHLLIGAEVGLLAALLAGFYQLTRCRTPLTVRQNIGKICFNWNKKRALWGKF